MKSKYTGLGMLLLAVAFLASCGSDEPPANIVVTATPSVTTLDQGATQQFSATVTGTSKSQVVWSVVEPIGGSITAQGLYTAPDRSGTFQVIATSVADGSKSARSFARINPVSLTIAPGSLEMIPGQSQQFTVAVTGTVHRDVVWSIQEGATGGTITSAGMYTPSTTAGQFHIVATSASDSTAFASVAVNVVNPAVSIVPANLNLLPGSTRALTASVLGSTDDRVTWAVQEGSVGGSISSDGVYAAPAEKGEYHIIASSVAFPGVFAIATVIITDSGFVDAGTMVSMRYGHTATLLQSGDVLLAGGGTDAESETASAELFHYSTGTFEATSNMTEPRAMHTATILPNGKVLIAGGSIDYGFGYISLDSAELYDPSTGQFTATGKMITKRGQHTATLLRNGKVLIVAGFLHDDFDATAELYDPDTGSFTQTGSLKVARGNHTATLLPDGRVLIAGGYTASGNAPSEIYDPATESFSISTDFSRDLHTATLLDDNRVLLAGGHWWDRNTGQPTYYADAQFFDPISGQLSFAANMSEKRSQQTATKLPNGDVLLIGGWNKEGLISTSELFVASSSSFQTGGTMNEARAGHTATRLLDDRILVTGGSISKSAEFYVQKQ